MFYALNLAIYGTLDYIKQSYCMVIACLLSFFSFIAKVESTSSVNSSSLLVKNDSSRIDETNYRKVYAYIKFMKNSKDNIHDRMGLCSYET